MRCYALLAVLCSLISAGSAEARLFRQTYGATVPTADGCVWNLNQDYFVPRHCDSCRYDLFSACKTSHTNSPACRYLHPVYGGYCTPYAACRYRWRDHVYKTYCGCTPLQCTYGSWHLEKCKKHCLALRHETPGCGECAGGMCEAGNDCRACGQPWGAGDGDFAGQEMFADGAYMAGYLPNVEPLEGETLGRIEVMADGASGVAAPGGAPTSGSPALRTNTGPASTSALPPLPIGVLPTSGAGVGLTLPSPGIN